MRKFKHKKTGIKIFESAADGFYRYFENKQKIIPKEIVENSNDWEEINEVKFKNRNVVKVGRAIVLITDYEKGGGYGIDEIGEWKKINTWSFKPKPELWQLATKEEWLEALTKEAENRYKAEDVIKRPDSFEYSGRCFFNLLGNDSLIGLNNFYYKGRQVMQDGIWAEVVKKDTLEELADIFSDFHYSNPVSLAPNFIKFFNENKETIHRLSN